MAFFPIFRDSVYALDIEIADPVMLSLACTYSYRSYFTNYTSCV